MISYFYPSLWFKKKWVWFGQPADDRASDMITVFSYDDVELQGFRKKQGQTSVIDLSPDLLLLWQRTRQGFVQKQIEKGKVNGIEARHDANFKDFKPVYLKFRKSKGLAKDRFEVFKKNGILISAYFENKLIAGGVFIADENNMRAWVLASLRHNTPGRMREIVGQANRMVVWQAIVLAKERGVKRFDLGGIDTDSKSPSEKGLTEFKEAFGGERKMSYYYTKVNSRLLRLLLKIRSLI